MKLTPAQRFVFPWLMSWEMGYAGLGFLLGAVWYLGTVETGYPPWKVVGGFLLALLCIPIVLVAVFLVRN